MMSPASVTLCRGKLTEGESDWRMTLVSVLPCRWSSSAGKMSTGTASSSSAVCRARCDRDETQGETPSGRVGGRDGPLRRLRAVADQSDSHRVRAGGHAADL